MDFDEMTRAVDQAATTLRIADRHATKMARILANRLHHVEDASALKDLKRELRDFNIHTLRWMDK